MGLEKHVDWSLSRPGGHHWAYELLCQRRQPSLSGCATLSDCDCKEVRIRGLLV